MKDGTLRMEMVAFRSKFGGRQQLEIASAEAGLVHWQPSSVVLVKTPRRAAGVRKEMNFPPGTSCQSMGASLT
jgi:hypothetical protein